MLNEDEEQSLDNNSSDDEELFQLDDNSEYDLGEDTLDDTKIEALFAPATTSAYQSYRDFITFIEVEKLMAKRKWSLQHIVLLYLPEAMLYTRFGG